MSESGVEPLRFVKFQREHLVEVLAIEREAYPEPWTEGMFRQELDNPASRFYVVFLGETLAGYGGFWLLLEEAHISSVTVRRESRRLGYGRRLVQFLLERIAEYGSTVATLEVRESNLRAQNLYASMEFKTVGRRKNYYRKTGEDAILMTRDISFDPPPGESRPLS